MNKREALKIAWNAADDKVDKYLQGDYPTFKYALGIRVGLGIALNILNKKLNEEEFKKYIESKMDF